MRLKIVISLVMIGAGIGLMYLLADSLGGLLAVTIGLMFMLFSLSIWTLPAESFERGHRLDSSQRRLAGMLLGVGLGMTGGLLIASLVPRPFNWIVITAVAIGVTIWWYRKP